MKKLALILFIIFSNYSFSKCLSGGFAVEHRLDSTVTNLTKFYISFYGDYKSEIDSAKWNVLELVSKKHKVRLKQVQKNYGLFRVNQGVYELQDTVIPGLVYHIEFSKSNGGGPLDSDKSHKSLFLTRKYTAVNTIKRNYNLDIKYNKPEVMFFGCGPAKYSVFDVDLGKDSLFNATKFIEVEFVNLTADETTNYIISYKESGKLFVGHSMCSGPFNYKLNHKYKARFKLVDTYGNSSNQTQWLFFDSPLN